MTRKGLKQTRHLPLTKVNEGAGVKEVLQTIGNNVGLLQDPPTFPGEMHLKGMNFVGPGTNLKLREQAGPPLNQPSKLRGPVMEKVDRAAMIHDYAYKKAGDDLKSQAATKEQFLTQIHQADDEFIKSLSQIPELSLTKTLALKAIQLKKFLEQSNLLDSQTFSGGSIPILKPAKMLMKERDGVSMSKAGTFSTGTTDLKGGFLPAIIPFLEPILAGIASSAATALINHFSNNDKKGAGYGYGKDLPPTSDHQEKIKYITHAFDNMHPDRQINLLHKVLIGK